MRLIKLSSILMLTILTTIMFVNAGLASAEATALCSVDEEESCAEENAVTHVHETTLSGSKAVLNASLLTVECDVLFLGDSYISWFEIGGIRFGKTVKLLNPLPIVGNFTYSNCSSGCEVKEENGPAELKVLKEFYETAAVTGEGLVHVNCSGLNCRYIGAGLEGVGLGPLLSYETNGSVTLAKQTVEKESGFFCPATSELTITLTPLETTYITS